MTDCLSMNLRLELEKTNQSLQRWAERKTEWLDSSQRNYQRMMEEAQCSIATLHDNEIQLEEVRHLNDVIRKQQLAEIHQQTAEIERLMIKKANLETQKVKLQEEEATESHRVASMQRELEEQQKLVEKSMNDMTHGIARFAALGLQFQRGHNQCMQFVFTQIDPANVNREFTFSLLVDTNERYQLVSTTPTIDSRISTKLNDELNADNNISKFVVQMRKEFCKLVRR